MPSGSPATEVSMTEVELVITASLVVRSTGVPSEAFSSRPTSSTNALRVPLPSSREKTFTEPPASAEA